MTALIIASIALFWALPAASVLGWDTRRRAREELVESALAAPEEETR